MTPQVILHDEVRDDAIKHLTAGVSVDLRGLPGSGKTTLTRLISDELEDSGWQIVMASGVLALRDRPLEALAIAGLMARQGGAQGPPTAVSAAVQGIMSAVRGGSTLLVIDDVDDLDEVSAGAITAAHQISPFALLTTSRNVPRSSRQPWRIPVVIQPGITIKVPPLGFVDTQTLLVEALGGPIDSKAIARVFAASGGLAGLTLALADGAVRHGRMRQVNGMWTAGPTMWTDEMMRAVDPLIHRLTPAALDGLHALALAGTVNVATAQQLMAWDVFEELDGYHLLQFVPRDDDMLVSVFPLALVEYFRHLGLGARHLKVDQAVSDAFGGGGIERTASTPMPWHLVGDSTKSESLTTLSLSGSLTGESDVVENRLLQEHWNRELLLRRSEWESSPTPRTAAALIRTMLVTDADADSVRNVRATTPRIGDSRELAAYDDWYALFVGIVEHDIAAVHDVLAEGRIEADEWTDLVHGIEQFIVLMVDHAPDPDVLPNAISIAAAPVETREIVTTVRTELLLAQGRSGEALADIETLGPVTSDFAKARTASRAWALHLEGRLDEALTEARNLFSQARRDNDVETIVGAAYVAAQVLLTRGRQQELRQLLGAVLSSAVLPAIQRPQHVALLSIAASIAADEGRATTARTLAEQALALKTGPGPFPLGSPTQALAHLDGADMTPLQARTLAAHRLWEEAIGLLDRGYLTSGFTCGMLAVVEEPSVERGALLDSVASKIPAKTIKLLNQFVQALCSGDPDRLIQTGHEHAELGFIWSATVAYSAGLASMRVAGSATAAAQVHEESKRRLAKWGDEASAGLRSAADGAELTPREEEIARLAASGMSNQDISRRLMISVRTVENHLHRVFRKLGVDNRSDMARLLAV